MSQSFSCHYCDGPIPLAGTQPGGRVTCPHCGVQADVPARGPEVYRPPQARGGGPVPAFEATAVNDAGNTALLFGILGLVLCQLLGPIAIAKGNQAKSLAVEAGLPVPGSANAGLILGWISTGIMILSAAFFCLIFGLAAIA
ncbi:MAG: DUF4190 domain-containing protein [Planctomycetota bacterium]